MGNLRKMIENIPVGKLFKLSAIYRRKRLLLLSIFMVPNDYKQFDNNTQVTDPSYK